MSARRTSLDSRASSCSGREPRGTNNFEFVSVVPTADGRARPNRQALVRKNAARYQWRKNKSAKALVRKPVEASPSREDGPVGEDEHPGDETQVTGSRYGLHRSRLALQTYYLSLAQDEKVAKIMTYSTFIHSTALRAP
jgi:hypothetical protein